MTITVIAHSGKFLLLSEFSVAEDCVYVGLKPIVVVNGAVAVVFTTLTTA